MRMSKRRFVFTYLLLFGLLLVACKISTDISSNKPKKLFKVSGTVTYTSDYCGGAPPSEDLIIQLSTPQPYPGKQLFIRSGSMNDVQNTVLHNITTDENGYFELELPPGEYCMVDEYRLNRDFIKRLYSTTNPLENIVPGDSTCIEDWFNSCLINITVSESDIDSLDFNISRPCFRPEGVPCLMYTGPYPP